MPAASGKHLSIIKSSAEREELAKAEREAQLEAEEKEQQRDGEIDARVGDGKNRFSPRVDNRHSSQTSARVRSRRRHRHNSKARRHGRLRHLRFHLKFAIRQVRRFHNRFTFRQVLRFYLGVPAIISLILCLAFVLVKPPKGVTPTLVSGRKPTAIELVQQIQAALSKKDSHAAHSAVKGLEEFYPKDPRTFVARGTVYAHEKNYDEARNAYLHALELAHDLPPALINLGEVEFAIGNYEQAAKYYEQAGQKIPRNPLVLFRRYLCYSLLKDRPKSEGVMNELADRPYSVEWYFIQASEALRAGKKPEAQRLLSTAKALFGEQAVAYQESLKKIGWVK